MASKRGVGFGCYAGRARLLKGRASRIPYESLKYWSWDNSATSLLQQGISDIEGRRFAALGRRFAALGRRFAALVGTRFSLALEGVWSDFLASACPRQSLSQTWDTVHVTRSQW